MRSLNHGTHGALSLLREGERQMETNSRSLSSDVTRRELLAVTAGTGGALVGGQLMPGIISPARAQDAGAASAPLDVVLRVNGTEHRLTLDPRTTLLDTLREHLHLTGSNRGCALGQRAACTVPMAAQPMKSCLSLAARVDGQ